MPNTFICSRCEEEWENSFMADSGVCDEYDENGFAIGETYFWVCFNCDDHSNFAGLEWTPPTPDDVELPF